MQCGDVLHWVLIQNDPLNNQEWVFLCVVPLKKKSMKPGGCTQDDELKGQVRVRAVGLPCGQHGGHHLGGRLGLWGHGARRVDILGTSKQVEKRCEVLGHDPQQCTDPGDASAELMKIP